METCLPDIPCISGIDLSDNGLDHEFAPVLMAISKNQALKKLVLSRNFASVKAKRLSNVLTAMVHLVHNEASRLEVLDIHDCKFRQGTSLILSAIGTNQHLRTIDLSGNMCGNPGARVLSKALEVNTRLDTLILDRNAITDRGFEDLAWGLQQNYSLKNMPYPVHDVQEAMRISQSSSSGGGASDHVVQTLRKIENILFRNQNPDDTNYTHYDQHLVRLHQSAYASTSSQVTDQLLVQIQDMHEAIKRNYPKYRSANSVLDERVAKCTSMVDAYKQLLARLSESESLHANQNIHNRASITLGSSSSSSPAKSPAPPRLPVDCCLGDKVLDAVGKLNDAMDGELRHRVENMCQQTALLFPDVFDKNQSFRSDLLMSARFADEFIARIRAKLDVEISKRMRQVLLDCGARLSQTVFESVVENLNHCHEMLVEVQKAEAAQQQSSSRPNSALASPPLPILSSSTSTKHERLPSLDVTDSDHKSLSSSHHHHPQKSSSNTHAKDNNNNTTNTANVEKETVIYGRLIRPPSQVNELGEQCLMLNAIKLSDLREKAPSPSEIPQEEPKLQQKLDHLQKERPKPKRKVPTKKFAFSAFTSSSSSSHNNNSNNYDEQNMDLNEGLDQFFGTDSRKMSHSLSNGFDNHNNTKKSIFNKLSSSDNHSKKNSGAKRKGILGSLFSSSSTPAHQEPPNNPTTNPKKSSSKKSKSKSPKTSQNESVSSAVSSNPSSGQRGSQGSAPATPITPKKSTQNNNPEDINNLNNDNQLSPTPIRRALEFQSAAQKSSGFGGRGAFSPSDTASRNLIAEMKAKQHRMAPVSELENGNHATNGTTHSNNNNNHHHHQQQIIDDPPPLPPRNAAGHGPSLPPPPSASSTNTTTSAINPPTSLQTNIQNLEQQMLKSPPSGSLPKNAIPVFANQIIRSKSFYTQNDQNPDTNNHHNASNTTHTNDQSAPPTEDQSNATPRLNPRARQGSRIKDRVKSLFAETND